MVNLIPIMTSNNSPSPFVVSASTTYNTTNFNAFNAFDKKDDTAWFTASGNLTGWIKVDSGADYIVDKYFIQNSSNLPLNAMPKSWTFEGSSTGLFNGEQIILHSVTNAPVWTAKEKREYTFNNTISKYRYYRINITLGQGSTGYIGIGEMGIESYEEPVIPPLNKILLLQNEKTYSFEKGGYGNNLIPNMTSNTAPSGIASASSTINVSPNFAWNSFDGVLTGNNGWHTSTNVRTGWLAYEFSSNTLIDAYSVSAINDASATTRSPKDWTFEGSNDGVNWTSLDSRVNQTGWSIGEKRYYSFKNNSTYKRYRINITENNGNTSYLAVGELEMMRQLPPKLNQLPSHSEQNLIKYGMDSPVQVDGIFSNKNYILQDTVSENTEGLWTTKINRKPLSIKFN